MKKLLMLAAVFAAGFAVMSCSSDNDNVAVNTGQVENAGNKFIAIGINLPQAAASATRADATDNNGGRRYLCGCLQHQHLSLDRRYFPQRDGVFHESSQAGIVRSRRRLQGYGYPEPQQHPDRIKRQRPQRQWYGSDHGH